MILTDRIKGISASYDTLISFFNDKKKLTIDELRHLLNLKNVDENTQIVTPTHYISSAFISTEQCISDLQECGILEFKYRKNELPLPYRDYPSNIEYITIKS